ncbi:proline--tRNA ligase, partial [Christensenellaceae bacterium OttesenSCG-928-L17]|nr:proline--tRNA ligase [Christensenellaceae bacterium OttesenSCG-928-L17]
LRIEVGPKDIEKNQVVVVRRDNLDEKLFLSMENLPAQVLDLLDDVHDGLFNKALMLRESRTVDATTFEELVEGVKTGFVRAMWCGDTACELEIKEKSGGASTRCMPFAQEKLSDVCVHCGKPAQAMTYFAKAY